MKVNRYLISLVLVLATNITFCQNFDDLRARLETIINSQKALVGVAICGSHPKDTLSINGQKHFPLQSVFKFHIALAVLDQVAQGNFTLHQPIVITKKALLPNLYSPLREKHPNGGTFPLSKLLTHAVSMSDNVACDALLQLIGGPQKVDAFLKSKGISNFAITFNEETMQSNWDNQFKNWTTPQAATQTLLLFYQNQPQLLSAETHAFLWNMMKTTQTGTHRIKGLLPKTAVVAHKTGTSGTNNDGITAAVNDIGVVFLPNGSYFVLSVFVSQSHENEKANEKCIAEIAKTTWDFFKKRQ